MGFTQPQTKLASFQGVASNQIATLSMPRGPKYFQIALNFKTAGGAAVTTAQIESEITEIKLRADGVDIIRTTPAELNMLQRFYQGAKSQVAGDANDDGVVLVDLAHVFNQFAFEQSLAPGTARLDSWDFEITCGTLVNVNVIEAFSVTSADPQVFGFHRRILTYPKTYNNTGEFEETELTKFGNLADVAYTAVHIPLILANVIDMTLFTNSIQLRDRIPVPLMNSLVRRAGRTPQPGYFHFIFDEINVPSGGLSMAALSDFRFRFNIQTAAPGSTRILTETLHKIPESFRGS